MASASYKNPSHAESSSAHFSLIPSIQKEDLKCIGELGKGGFGTVYKAHHKSWGDVAVKICNKTMSDDAMKRAHREVERMVRASNFDYIVQIRAIIHEDARTDCCIVMEYMEHGSLQKFQNRLNTFPVAVKIKMIYEITLGMNYLHTLNPEIIHRDLKLENIFVGKGFTAKVGDLGLATWCAASNFKERVGTITHIPPESLKDINRSITTKYDVYSFGITLWEFAAGKRPYEYCNTVLIEMGVTGGQRPEMSDIADDEPDIVKELMEDCWQQDPKRRPSFQKIKEKIDEYKTANKRDYKAGHAEIYKQLNEISEQKSDELLQCKSPWEQDSSMDINDSPSNPETVKSHAVILNKDADEAKSSNYPKPLHSGDFAESSKVGSHPVPESDTQQGRNLPFIREVMEKMAEMKLMAPQPDEDKYGITETIEPEPKMAPATASFYQSQPSHAASHADEQQPGDPQLNTAGEFHLLGGLQAPPVNQSTDSAASFDQYGRFCDTATDPAESSGTAIRQTPPPLSEHVTFEPKRRNKQSDGFFQQGLHGNPQPHFHKPAQPYPYYHPMYPQYVSSPHPFPPAPPTDNNAQSISINVKGDGNYVTVARGGSTVNIGRKKSSKKKKSKKTKPAPPPPSPPSSSSSSSSSVSDSSEAGDCKIDSAVVQKPSITTSRDPVTEQDIYQIAEDIGKRYKKLGRKLGLKGPQIENIEEDNRGNQEEMAVQVMLIWKSGGRRAEVTKAALAQALLKVGLQDVAERL